MQQIIKIHLIAVLMTELLTVNRVQTTVLLTELLTVNQVKTTMLLIVYRVQSNGFVNHTILIT